MDRRGLGEQESCDGGDPCVWPPPTKVGIHRDHRCRSWKNRIEAKNKSQLVLARPRDASALAAIASVVGVVFPLKLRRNGHGAVPISIQKTWFSSREAGSTSSNIACTDLIGLQCLTPSLFLERALKAGGINLSLYYIPHNFPLNSNISAILEF